MRQIWTEVLNEGGTESTTCRVAFVEIDNETERLIVILIGSSDCSNSKVKLNISRMCVYVLFVYSSCRHCRRQYCVRPRNSMSSLSKDKTND